MRGELGFLPKTYFVPSMPSSETLGLKVRLMGPSHSGCLDLKRGGLTVLPHMSMAIVISGWTVATAVDGISIP
jgi:hypothetical protein